MRTRLRSIPDDDSLDEPLINLTPLIDVVFVVLISFILIAPVLDIDSVELASSGAATKNEVQKKSPISITVHADNTIWFQGKKVTLAQLEIELKKEIKKYPHTAPELIHDSKAHFGTYQSIKNTLESIGFEQMDVILKPS